MQFQQNQKVIINGGTITVSGSVTIAGGSVAISGTPNVNITGGSVAISGTPTVQFASGQTVSITGTPNVNVTGGSITISSGSVSITAGTITQITDNVNVNQAVTNFYSTTNNFSTTNPFTHVGITPTQAAQGFHVVLGGPAATQHFFVALENITTGDQAQGSVILQTNAISGVGVYVNALPLQLACDAGDSLTLKIQCVDAVPANIITTINVLGLSTSPVIQTQPGEPITTALVGGMSHISHAFAGAGAFALLPAPPIGFVYRLQRWLEGSGAAGVSGILTGTGTGFLYGISVAASVDNLEGLLAGEGLTAQASAAMTVYLSYDLIATPTIQ